MKSNMLMVVFLLLAAAAPCRAGYETAMEDYQAAKDLMSSKDAKKEAGKVLALLTRARNDLMAVKRTKAQEQKLVEISQALYWQYKMKPFSVTVPHLPPRAAAGADAKPEEGKDAPGEGTKDTPQPDTEAVPPGPGAVETPAKDAVEDKPAVAPAREAQPGPAKPEPVKPLEIVPSSAPPSYALAMDYRQKHPEDRRTQYIMFGQALEETDQQELVTRALELMEEIRLQLKDRREMYQEQWMKEMPSLKTLIDKRQFADARRKVEAYMKSGSGDKLDEDGKACFMEFATRVLVLEECQARLLAYDFRESIPMQDLVKGMKGRLTGATPTQLSIVDGSINQQADFPWAAVELPGLASAAAETASSSSPRDAYFKAMAYKVTRQFERAYDVFGDLQRKHPEEKSISENLQDCELQYLEDKGAPLDGLIKKARKLLDDGNRDQAKKSLDEIRRQLNHPLLAVYNHQVQLIRKKHSL